MAYSYDSIYSELVLQAVQIAVACPEMANNPLKDQIVARFDRSEEVLEMTKGHIRNYLIVERGWRWFNVFKRIQAERLCFECGVASQDLYLYIALNLQRQSGIRKKVIANLADMFVTIIKEVEDKP